MSDGEGVGDPGPERTPASAAARASGTAGIRRLVDVFAAALGVGKSRAPETAAGATDTSTRLAHERTDLAMERTYWAAERTLMGWIRTALSMISFGFTIGKIGEALRGVEVRTLRGVRVVGVETLAYLFVTLGTLALAAATAQYLVRVHALRARGLRRQPSIAFAVAIVLTLVGALALTALVANL